MAERRRVVVPDFVGEPVHVAIEAAAELGLVLVGPDPDGPSLRALTWPGLFWVTEQWTMPGIAVEWGSEVEIALKAQKLLAEAGVSARVVSMPCTNVFDRQDEAYRNTVLPLFVPRVAVEAAQPDFWRKYVGLSGGVVGIATFGESAPIADLYKHFKITAEHTAEVAQAVLRMHAARHEAEDGNVVRSMN
ncbi:MAG: hypothetical protein B7X42_04370 [Thiomonas sp. 14-66-4]|nr:MAG: hypothetical protein B7X42_04370 [Thiomonas sp. 14-66-4]